jgi:aldose sugar dehydrogenase
MFILLNLIVIVSGFYFTPANSDMITQFKEGPVINDINLKAELVLTGEIKFPTSMAFLGPNDILMLEKNEGTVKRITNGTMLHEPLLDTNVANQNERGMLGIAVATELFKHEKENAKTKSNVSTYIFLYYTESKEKDGDDITEAKEPLGNRLYRYELVDNKLVNPKLLLEIPTGSISVHNGGKIIIGPDDNVYVAIGNLQGENSKLYSKAQNSKNGTNPDGAGGILRVTVNGKVVEPIIEKKDLDKYYAYGIRNSFGIEFDPVTGKLWDTENGPGFGDEINLVEPGFNSGWMKVQGIWQYPYGKPYGTIGDVTSNPQQDLVDFNGKGKYSSPEFTWKQAVGPTDITFLNSTKLGKRYENDLFVGDFHNGYLYHFDLNKERTELSLKGPLNDKVAIDRDELKNVIFAKGFGGITDIAVGPDGYLYVLSLQSAGSDCETVKGTKEKCISYSSGNVGSIYRIVPAFDKDKSNLTS